MFLNSKAVKQYFKHLGEDEYVCECGRKRKQKPNTGFSNLINHLNTDHANWKQNMKLRNQTFLISAEVSAKAYNIFAWIDWIITDNRVLRFVEGELTRKYSNLTPIDTDTLVKYMDKLVTSVEANIKENLPEKFGLIFDGWSDQTSTHYFGIYAVYSEDVTKPRKVRLLAFSPLLSEEDLSAESHVAFLSSTLSIFGKTVTDILFVV